MKIGNQKVQGLFLYEDNIPYEYGDFVIHDNVIYICTPKTSTEIINVIPNTVDGNYKIYLGDKMTNVSEYFKYIEDPSNYPDKYVSAQFLSEIMSTYMIGLDEKGVIDQYVSYAKEEGVLSYSPFFDDILKDANVNDVLDLILTSPEINNAVFRVSRDIIPSLPTTVYAINPLDLKSVLLKQYTYLEDNSIQYRVQEIIDPVNSIILYRYSSLGNTSVWKNSSVNLNFKSQVDTVINHYNKLIAELNAEKTKLTDFAFRFRNCEITKGNIVYLQCTNSNNSGYIDVDDFENFGMINVILLKSLGNNTYRSYSLCVNLSEIVSIIGKSFVFNTGDTSITLEAVDVNNITIICEEPSVVVSNVYYQYFYQ